MKKFVFKLKPVLHQRQRKEDILKKELAEARRALEVERERLAALNERLQGLHAALREKQLSMTETAEVAVHTKFIERIEREIEVQLARVTDLAAEVRAAQERLLEAAKDRKVLEKLEEKQLHEFKQEAERVEQGVIDEIATVRHNRNNSNPLRSTNAE